MNLPPLPLVDGAFLIDNSGLEKLKCPRMFQYSELSRRTPCAELADAVLKEVWANHEVGSRTGAILAEVIERLRAKHPNEKS